MSYRIFCRLRLSFARAVTLLAGLAVCLGTAAAASEVKLIVQRRDDGGTPVREIVRIDPAKTVVVVVDMWDRHWCKTFTARVGNMVGRMNLALDAVRKLGGQVVFAPSDALEPYKDSAQRKAMLVIPEHPVTKAVVREFPPHLLPRDHCECGPDEPCGKGRVWTRQGAGLRIDDRDLIGDCNNGRELLNLCQERGIDTLLYMGVASNMCVQHRGMGLRQMIQHGLRTFVVRDLVEAITANGIGPDGKPDPNFTPAKGSVRVERQIEQSICPTIESRQLLHAAGMGRENGRPHIVFVIAEGEYKTRETLPTFAKKYLEKDFRCTFCFAEGDSGDDRNDVPGLEALYDADLLVLSMRRRALPVTQMDHLERFIRSGRPIVGIRVSVVPFQVREKIPPGHVGWRDFDREVLGCQYHGYDGQSRKIGCDVWTLPDAAKHPILANVKPARFHSPSWIYRQQPLAESVTILMNGRWSEAAPEEPVAWTNTYNGGRVFYTTLGHPDDFEIESFNQLLLGGIRWALQTGKGPTTDFRAE